MTADKLKKHILPHLPYLIIVWFCAKLSIMNVPPPNA
jgi:hypothetical protein